MADHHEGYEVLEEILFRIVINTNWTNKYPTKKLIRIILHALRVLRGG